MLIIIIISLSYDLEIKLLYYVSNVDTFSHVGKTQLKQLILGNHRPTHSLRTEYNNFILKI